MFLGEVFTWGDNDEGQLGDGSTNAIQRPRLVAALQQGKKINRVACGSAHTLAWSTNKPVATGKMPSSVSRVEHSSGWMSGLTVNIFVCFWQSHNFRVFRCMFPDPKLPCCTRSTLLFLFLSTNILNSALSLY